MITIADLRREIAIINAHYTWQRLSITHECGNKYKISNKQKPLIKGSKNELMMFSAGYRFCCEETLETVEKLKTLETELASLTNSLSLLCK